MSSVRIGNAQAFWGDRSDAAADMLALEPNLDYLTLDYLAEVSLSILAAQRDRDPALGYPRDFLDVVRSLVPYWNGGGRCRLIANSGGLNPHGCAEACRQALEAAGCRPMRIGVVRGDDVLATLRTATDREHYRNLDTGASIETVLDRLVTANAYVGAAPIVEALQRGADIVITGRVADPSLTVAAAVHHFGWSLDDWQRLAGATVAGHLIECGTQVTGGISTDWLTLPDVEHLGFPLVEIDEDGNCVVTKPNGSGGCVTTWTVKEQLVYEIGDPDRYLSPDVEVSFLGLNVEDLGGDRVRVTGAVGRPAPQTLKVSATFRDGYRSAGMLTVFGRNASQKARRAAEIVLHRISSAGFELRDVVVETLGAGGCYENVLPWAANESLEVVVRIAVESESRAAVERFTKELMPLITAGPQGTTGYAEGRPTVHPVVRYWPCRIDRSAVRSHVEIVDCKTAVPAPQPAGESTGVRGRALRLAHKLAAQLPNPQTHPPTLHDLARARSGDKGTGANIGILARNADAFRFLDEWLTADRVAGFLQPLGVESVDRYELPNLQAFNFVVKGILRRNLRTDAQGKALGQLLLEMPLTSPDRPGGVPDCYSEPLPDGRG